MPTTTTGPCTCCAPAIPPGGGCCSCWNLDDVVENDPRWKLPDTAIVNFGFTQSATKLYYRDNSNPLNQFACNFPYSIDCDLCSVMGGTYVVPRLDEIDTIGLYGIVGRLIYGCKWRVLWPDCSGPSCELETPDLPGGPPFIWGEGLIFGIDSVEVTCFEFSDLGQKYAGATAIISSTVCGDNPNGHGGGGGAIGLGFRAPIDQYGKWPCNDFGALDWECYGMSGSSGPYCQSNNAGFDATTCIATDIPDGTHHQGSAFCFLNRADVIANSSISFA